MGANFSPEVWVSIYAAVVGTGALLLNLKSWIDSGVKIRLEILVDGVVFSENPNDDEKDLIILFVTNIGASPTIISNMVIFDMSDFWRFPLSLFKVVPKKSYLVINPQHVGMPPIIPAELGQNQRWTGIIRKRDDILQNIRDGHHYAGIYTTHRDKPYIIRIRKQNRESIKGDQA